MFKVFPWQNKSFLVFKVQLTGIIFDFFQADELINKIFDSFYEVQDEVDWMDDTTKGLAREKVSIVYHFLYKISQDIWFQS